MSEKIVGILVMTLLIITTIDVMGGDISNSENIIFNENEEKINSLSYEPGTYLLTTRWGQWTPYNSKCPMNNESGTPYRDRLGCWSVAIGQIINYHHNYYDLQSVGINNYWCTSTWMEPQHIVNNLDEHYYDWSQMANIPTSYAEKDNVSRLLFDTATIIQKDFGTGGYCTFSDTDDLTVLINELINHFPGVTSLTEWDNNLTASEIINEIDNERPIMFYCIGHNISDASDHYPHAWVIDGYRLIPDPTHVNIDVHFNYGWTGTNDGWYNYYGTFPINDNYFFNDTNYRKGLLIRLIPLTPVIHGPRYGLVGIPLNYTASTIYDVNPPLYYKFDWGDGTFTEWLGRYDSGEQCVATHTWKKKGTYDVRVKAKDVDGLESDWSDPLSVIMSKGKSIIFNSPLITWIFERFPIFEKILNLYYN